MKGMHVYLNLDDLQQFGQGGKKLTYIIPLALSRKQIKNFKSHNTIGMTHIYFLV